MINPNDITTVRVDQLPPDEITLTDIFPFETADQFLKKATFQDLVSFMSIYASALQFEVKRMSVTQTYIDDNFDVTGLGKNLCLGYAICNGENGTENLDGLVGIGYGSTYSNIGGFGGEKNHTLTQSEIPSLQVPYTGSSDDTGDNGSFLITSPNESNGAKNLTATGGGLSHNNMQPYVVNLYIMKL